MMEEFYISKYDSVMSLEDYLLTHNTSNAWARFTSKIKNIPRSWLARLNKEDVDLVESRDKYESDVLEIEISGADNGEVDTTEHDSDQLNKTELIQKIIDRQEPLSVLSVDAGKVAVMEILLSRINVSSSGRFVILDVNMPEPLLCVQLNNFVFEKIIEQSIRLKTDKEIQSLKITQEKYDIAREKFLFEQNRLSEFRDKNKGSMSEKQNAEELRLRAEYDIAFNIFNSIAVDLEQKKIELEEKVPLYSEFDPVTIPLRPTSPNRVSIIMKYLFMGIGIGIFSIVFFLIRDFALVYLSAFRSKNIKL